jgi:hypothetical protein
MNMSLQKKTFKTPETIPNLISYETQTLTRTSDTIKTLHVDYDNNFLK